MRWHTYLFAALWLTFQVGCCVEAMLRTAIKWVHALRWPDPLKIRLALQANCHLALANDLRFDSNSFAIGVDNHASRCMGNNKRLFDNLILARTSQRVEVR